MTAVFTPADSLNYGPVSASVVVNVVPLPPQIVLEPSSLTVVVGETVELWVQAIGHGNLRYQWRKNGESISNAVSNQFLIQDVTMADEGSYDVVVSNDGGSVASLPVHLKVVRCMFVPLAASTTINIRDVGMPKGFKVERNQTFRIEASDDYNRWEAIFHSVGTSQIMEFIDTEARLFSYRFYRIVMIIP